MIKAAIFDMDGLLINSEPLWRKVHRAVFKDVGIVFTERHDAMVLGHRTPEAVELVYRDQPWRGPSTNEVAERVEQEIIKEMKRSITLQPGVHHVLQVCKDAGLPVAIASSSPLAVIDAVVDTLQIREHFDHIYSAQFEKHGKPNPAVFLQVAKHFKVPAPDCIVFEDSPAGVLAAKSAKMICIAVPEKESKGNRFISIADAVLDSLNQFDPEMLAQLE